MYIFSVPTVGVYVYKCSLFDTLNGLFIVDVGGSVRDKFAQFFIVDVGSHVGLC